MSGSSTHIPYLIVATEYATTCAGSCPTCVLSKEERLRPYPATTSAAIISGIEKAAAEYGHVGTLALGIGRANVLDLPDSSIDEIGLIVAGAAAAFHHDELVIEISTSLVGKIDRQIAQAMKIMKASEGWGGDVRFVIVANTALHSEKYWRNVDVFYAAIEAARGAAGEDGHGDIIQLALALDSLPDPDDLATRIRHYRSPVNLTWAPAFDRGIAGEGSLLVMEKWLDRWFALTSEGDMDSSLVNRIRQSLGMLDSSMKDAAEHAEMSGRAVVYVGTDGTWHNGLFTVLAEMDPVRFDPAAGGRAMSGTEPKELRRFLTNPSCSSCEFANACIASASHRIGMITLRQFPDGTEACPSGLRAAFASASMQASANRGSRSNGYA